SGGTLNLYAACDGIDAAYDAVIDGAEATVNIYTDSFSEYSKEVSKTAKGAHYIRFTSRNYNYSVKYYNSDSDFVWVNATYEKSVQGGRSTYYYYTFESKTGYDKVAIFIYSADQKQGQEEDFLVATDYISWNEAYDTFALRQSGSSLSYSWANISDPPVEGGMGGPGGGRPGAPGGMGGMDGGNNDKLEYSAKGIKAGNSITVNNGNVNIKAYDDAIHANADTTLENGASPTGNVTINGGNITIYTNDDGIHADGTLLVTNGTVKVDKAYEGLEGIFVRISGGNISIESSDDGVNATTRSGQAIVISGGTLYIYAKGDGIDSNSTASYEGIVFSGGKTTVISTSGGNSAIDSERGYSYLGGNVLAIMPSGGMSGEATNCKNFSSVATKTSMSLREGQTLTVSVGSNTVMSVNIPSNISGMVVYLGSNTAKFS
ncbi:MAG: carbohydrate-binding domain-containing protein, partial [Clostridia bacterium]|nr:carbohydrate-binding domain-containing protein [Clostridia bacterium]